MSVYSASSMHPQLSALVSLRWHMIREPRVRWGLVLLALVPLAFCALGIVVLQLIPDDEAFNIAVATPTLYLGFALLAIIAPLAAGGGYELYPSEQLVAYPVKPRTVFRGTLLLAPANLAWILNVACGHHRDVPGRRRPHLVDHAVTAFCAGVHRHGHRSRTGLRMVGRRYPAKQEPDDMATWAVGGSLRVSTVLVIVRLDLAFDALDCRTNQICATQRH